MGFLEKLSNRVRSTDTNQVTHTVDIEEKLTNKNPEGANTDENNFSISSVVSSFSHFWNSKIKTVSEDPLNSELSQQLDKPSEKLAEQTEDLHSFFDSMKESLIKGTDKLKNSIANQADTQEKPTSAEINDSTHITDDSQLDIESKSAQNISSENTSFESLKNFFDKSITKINETVNNIDNLADSLGSNNTENNNKEALDSENTVTNTRVKPENNKQTPVISKTKESQQQEVEKRIDSTPPPPHITDKPQSKNDDENNELSYNYIKNIFNKSIKKIKETVSSIDKLADSTISDDSILGTAEATIKEEQNTATTATDKALLTPTEEITKNNVKEKIDSTDNEISPTGSEKQVNETQSISSDEVKGFFSQSLNKIKKTSQSLDISNSVKSLIDKGSDKISLLGSSDSLDIDIDLNESETALKKENLEQLIAESVTETQKLAQIFDDNTQESNKNNVSIEPLLPEEDKTAIEKLTEITPPTSPKASISTPSVHYMTQKMTGTTVVNKGNINFKSNDESKNLIETNKEAAENSVNILPDSNSKPDQPNNLNLSVTSTLNQAKQEDPEEIKSITDTDNTLNDGNKEQIDSLETNQNLTNTLPDSQFSSGHSINLKEPTLPTPRQLGQTTLNDSNIDQEEPLNIQSKTGENDQYSVAPLSKSTPVTAEETSTDESTNITSTHQVKNIEDTADNLKLDIDSTAKDSLNPEKHSIKTDLSDIKKILTTEAIEAENHSTLEQTYFKDKIEDSSAMPLVESSILKAEQLDSITEYKVKPSTTEDLNSENEAVTKPLSIKSRGLFWGLALFLLTTILAGLWWLTFSDNTQHSKDTGFVNFESLAHEKSEQKPLNQTSQTDNLPINVSDEISESKTVSIESKVTNNITKNDANNSEQSTTTHPILINTGQNDRTDGIISKDSILEIKPKTTSNAPSLTHEPDFSTTSNNEQDLALLTTANDIAVNTETQNSIINNPIANITTFLNKKDGSLPKGFILHGLTFETASSRLSKSSAQIISDLATLLKAHPSIKIRLEGHTDSVGNEQKNQRLSANRAQAVKSKLVVLEIDPTRIKAAGLGEEFPIMDNETKIGQQNNRRVEVIIVDGWFLK